MELGDAIYDSQAPRGFLGIDLGREAVPGATTLLGFRHLLEGQGLTELIFETVDAGLRERGLMPSKDTITDAAILVSNGLETFVRVDRVDRPPYLNPTLIQRDEAREEMLDGRST